MRIRGAVLQECGRPGPWAESRPLAVAELELDEPGPGELLVRLEAAGVCHSDLSVVDGNRVRPVPMLLGHEACGVVAKAGPGVDLAEGQRVVLYFVPRCEECDACRAGGRVLCSPGWAANGAGTLLSGARRLHWDGQDVHHHCGVSGFATHAVVDRHSVVPIGDDVPPDIGALLGCAVLTGGGAVKNAGRLEPGEDVTVVGVGGVGMAAVLVALACGAGQVTVVDPLPGKRSRGLELGAAKALTPEEAVGSGHRSSLVVEASGNARAFETAVSVTAPGGRTVSVGLASPEARSSISPLALVSETRTIIGSFLGSGLPAQDIPEYADLWRAGKLPVDQLVSGTIDLDDINRAMDELAAGRAMRQVIRFS
ncbi:alcohol dehydrogenase catalytic domain-containing protein [Saccharopolyspora hirsuta]|uniref:Alcohol dehydrogenase catalytic domain-containing protein n=1 Tax=Saccharopolyspora hirsuta TaxID=1837 RepID=A0A5M7BZH1_SACHI|nr:alcohol dehydrogenase catalytic domain-containing protein [Saccharopolyspora hirsuta]KAA5833488.1 alcohol dehydrogenase catalytic domain-containing protein [Saccharopolyspora hirsuta]MBF6507827.1 alcohol dehydrogenase catalytic domain-containing protein [Nocardia farcinica]